MQVSTDQPENFPALSDLVQRTAQVKGAVTGARHQFEKENVEGEYYWLHLAEKRVRYLLAYVQRLEEDGYGISQD